MRTGYCYISNDDKSFKLKKDTGRRIEVVVHNCYRAALRICCKEHNLENRLCHAKQLLVSDLYDARKQDRNRQAQKHQRLHSILAAVPQPSKNWLETRWICRHQCHHHVSVPPQDHTLWHTTGFETCRATY